MNKRSIFNWLCALPFAFVANAEPLQTAHVRMDGHYFVPGADVVFPIEGGSALVTMHYGHGAKRWSLFFMPSQPLDDASAFGVIELSGPYPACDWMSMSAPTLFRRSGVITVQCNREGEDGDPDVDVIVVGFDSSRAIILGCFLAVDQPSLSRASEMSARIAWVRTSGFGSVSTPEAAYVMIGANGDFATSGTKLESCDSRSEDPGP